MLKPDAKIAELETDRAKNISAPPVQKEYQGPVKTVTLIPPTEFQIGEKPLLYIIQQRRSRRKYSKESLDLNELSCLLWATQGRRQDGQNKRTVPSGGNCHPFETYLVIQRVENILPGLYHYLPIDHTLQFIDSDPELMAEVAAASLKYQHVSESAVVFVWTVIPYRTCWRYQSNFAAKLIAIDAGHVCQNLYLAGESLELGVCAIAYYDQDKWDRILGVNGVDEFSIYQAAVGKIPTERV